jgi:hypothetical protein
MIDPREVLDFMEAANNVVEAQTRKMDKMAAEISSLQAWKVGAEQFVRNVQEATGTTDVAKMAALSKKAADEGKVWSLGKPAALPKKASAPSTIRESDRKFYERFGIPYKQ